MSRFRTRKFWSTVFWRLLILAAVILAWQFVPQMDAVRERVNWMNPFFVSSPTRVAQEMYDLATASNGAPSVWPDLWVTIKTTLIGTGIGLTIGTLLGAFLSNNQRLAEIVSVYVTLLNSMPRVALIPIIVIIVGTGSRAAIVASAIVVTFLTFFNAFEGGRSVPLPMLQNAQVLRAKKRQIMTRVRFPHVLIWTFAAVPNAVAFGLVSVVTTQLLTGTEGMGGLMLTATSNLDADLSFAVMIYLSVIGIVLVTLADRVKRAVLHWR
jgi:NitT/TauT family transport system permease protein